MVHRVGLHLLLDETLQLLRQALPGAHVHGQIHQVNRLVQGSLPRRAHADDVLRDLGKSQVPVDGRADIVSGVDSALFQRRIDVRTGHAGGTDAKLLEHFRHHAAGQANLHALELLQALYRTLGMDDVGVVLDRPNVEEPEFLVDLACHLQQAETVEHGVPLRHLVRTGGIGGQEHRGRNLARPVEREGVHALQHAGAHGVEQGVVVRCHRLGRERPHFQLAVRFLLKALGPFLEQLVPGGAGVPR